MNDKNQAQVVQDYLDDLYGDGDATPCDTGTPCEIRLELPKWFDEEKFKRGQQFCLDNLFSVSLAQFCGLLAMVGVCQKLVRILHFTKNSSTPCTAYKRYSSTMLHIITWYTADLTPGSESWNSIENIRKRHLYYSGLTNKHGLGFFTQKDMVETQFALMSFVFSRSKQIGIHDSNKREMDAFVHFWRTIGYMFGVKDRFNICREKLEVTTAICITYLEGHIRNNYSIHIPEAFKMQNAFLEPMTAVNGALNPKRMLYVTRSLIGLKGYECFQVHNNFKAVVNQDNKCQSNRCEFRKLSIMMQLRLLFGSLLVEQLFKFIAIRYICNYIIKMSLFCVKYLPPLAIVKFGRNNAYIKH